MLVVSKRVAFDLFSVLFLAIGITGQAWILEPVLLHHLMLSSMISGMVSRMVLVKENTPVALSRVLI